MRERINLTGILHRSRQRKSAGDWLTDYVAILLEQAGRRNASYYPERVWISQTGRLSQSGREQLFRFARAPKCLECIPDGTRVEVSALAGWWENGLGANLTRPILLNRS